ncbi:RiPP maturation radical SAM C-methyltransferase [Sorangium sp. So ce131]|uniref:RiPP maturation radical SAM C-methyltransferase n=1 Tax=Sorangium sp. So ce131 TaxID=3133282 RepID=UPI003F61CEBB
MPITQESAPTVVFVGMPFGILQFPSLGLALLQAQLRRAGIPARTLHLHLDFAQLLGVEAYQLLSEDGGPGVMPGEWVFSAELFGDSLKDAEFVRDQLAPQGKPRLVEAALCARRAAADFLAGAARRILDLGPAVVGFTSLFQQHVPSLALARRLRRERPELRLLLGGANCEGETGFETARSFPFLDAVVSGEADEIIVDLIGRLLEGRDISRVPGVFTPAAARRMLSGPPAEAPRVHAMDALPHPDFDGFFAQYTSLPRGAPRPIVPFETSRGCWWGQKHHCVFCGLNPDLMAYRSKSAARAIEEIDALAAAHPGLEMAAMDNILDTRYFDEVMPGLARRPERLSIFYEMKANTRPAQIQRLRSAGVRTVQPGIESLSSRTLARMDKGVTAAQNISLLASLETYGVSPFWLLISGFPEETEEDLEATMALFPRLAHLQPPSCLTPLQINRFSPHFQRPEEYGLTGLRPTPAHDYIYPLPREAVSRLAYYFSFEYRDHVRPPEDVRAIVAALKTWRARYQDSFVFYADHPDGALCVDHRGSGPPCAYTLSPLSFAILAACAEPRTGAALLRRVSSASSPCDKAALDAELALLDALGLVFREGEHTVTVALRWRDYVLPDPDEPPFRRIKHERARELLRSHPLCSTDEAAAAWRA